MNIPISFPRYYFSPMHIDLLSRFVLVAKLKTPITIHSFSPLKEGVEQRRKVSAIAMAVSIRLKLKSNCMTSPISSTLSTGPTILAFYSPFSNTTRSFKKLTVVFYEVIKPFFIPTMSRSPEIHLIRKR